MLDWISSRQHEERHLHCGDLVNQEPTFVSREFQRMSLGLRAASAMHIRQVRCLRHFPDRNVWPFVEVDFDVIRIHAPI